MTDLVPALTQLLDSTIVRALFVGLLLMFGAGASFLVARKIVRTLAQRAIARTQTQWDDALANRGVLTQITYLAPAIVLYYGTSFFSGAVDILARIILVYVVVNLVIITTRLLAAGNDIYQTYPISHKRPIKVYVQLASLVHFFVQPSVQ